MLKKPTYHVLYLALCYFTSLSRFLNRPLPLLRLKDTLHTCNPTALFKIRLERYHSSRSVMSPNRSVMPLGNVPRYVSDAYSRQFYIIE